MELELKVERRAAHRRNPELEQLLKEINALLAPAATQAAARFSSPKYPVLCLISVPRCGSTLFMQWLAGTGCFTYPTNLLSRFYGAPYVGALIQQLLTDARYNFNDEILDFNTPGGFESRLGKTRGALGPNEFWYFWRRFFPCDGLERLDETSFAKEVAGEFAAELAAVEAVLDKPWALKCMHLTFNLPYLSGILPSAVFVHLKRHPFYAMQSIWRGRLDYFGDLRQWWSTKPPEYAFLKDLDPWEQIAGQVYFTERGIEAGVASIDPRRRITVEYESFCRNPEEVFHVVRQTLRAQNFAADWRYAGPAEFPQANQVRLDDDDCARLIGAYRGFAGVDLTL